MGPTLSRSWVEVWLTCPALHAASATGEKSRTPTVAARSARFTAVDLPGTCRPPDAGDPTGSVPEDGASVTVAPGAPPGGKAAAPPSSSSGFPPPINEGGAEGGQRADRTALRRRA